MALSPRSLIPRPGNAARPVFFLAAGASGLTLVGVPIIMYWDGQSAANIVWITLLIIAASVGILWFTVQLGKQVQQDEAQLESGEGWAEWTVSVEDHRKFFAAKRRSANRQAGAYVLGGSAFSVVLAWLEHDRLLGVIGVGVFLMVGLATFIVAGPPRRAMTDDDRHVKIGPYGVHALGQYRPFESTMLHLRRVEIDAGDPAVMRFSVRSGRHDNAIEVPVPADQMREAEALAARLREMHDL